MSDEELEKFVVAWIKKAKAGKAAYLVALLERWAGKTTDWASNERLSALEEAICTYSEQADGKAKSRGS